MKLSKKEMLLVSFMLFSLFFGAGNLIFPPFLGQSAGAQTPVALAGFLITAVVLPVLGVIAVAEFNGMDKLAGRVNKYFALVFTLLIYLSIGPGLGIPRAASVPFEMAIAPYLPDQSSFSLYMLAYSSVFFATACWLALTPNKLITRIGKVLTPSLLTLLAVLFFSFLMNGNAEVAAPQPAYAEGAFVTGFLEGYNTMDAIAALNFGLVIATTLKALNVTDKSAMMNYTVRAGIAAGSVLTLIYAALSYLGMQSSAVYELENGAWTLRCITHQLFGNTGAVFLASTFTLACLTTCVGLITSISQFFTTLTHRLSYRQLVLGISGFSFVVCNQGLNTILSISVPVLNAIYPTAIVLILLGICDKWLKNNSYVYPLVVWSVSAVSVVYAADAIVPLGFLSEVCNHLPFYSIGMGWVTVAVAMLALSLAFPKLLVKAEKEEEATSC